MSRFLSLVLGVAVVMLAGGRPAAAVAKTAAATGLWSATATWGGTPPVAGDTVTIPAGYTVTVDTNASCASISFAAANTVNGITLSGTNSLTVSGAITTVVPAASPRSTRLAVGAGTLTAGSLALAGAGTATRYTELSISTGSATISGNLTTAGFESRITFTGAGILRVGGGFMTAATPGTLKPATGTIEFTGAAQQIRGTNYNNLVVNAGAGNIATLATNPAIAGDLTIASGSLNLAAFSASRMTAGGVLAVSANAGLIVSGAANFPANYTTVTLDPLSTVQYAYGGAQNVQTLSYGHLTLSGSGAKAIGAGVTVAGGLSIAPTGTAAAALADGLNLAVDTLTLGGYGRTNGTWGSSASGATWQDDAFFAPSTGLLTVNTDSRTTSTVTIAGAPAEYAAPAPLGYGANGGLVSGDWITNGVASSVLADGLGWRCDGWALTKTAGGSAVTGGSGTQAVFQVSTNLTLTWKWTNFWLSIVGFPASSSTASPLNYGSYTNIEENTWVTNTILTPGSAVNGKRSAATGWSLAYAGGTPIDSGSDTQAVFRMPADTVVLTWNWTNEYLLTTSANSNGTVSAGGWYVQGSQAQLDATAEDGYVFLQWTGDVPSGHTNNPLLLTLDKARSVKAQFALATPAVRSWQGGIANWFTVTNWVPQGVPGTGDTVILGKGTSVLTDPAWAGSLLVSNATLIFSNWVTCLAVTGAVQVALNGTLTTPASFYRSTFSNRVYLVCGSMAIDSGGKINVDDKGYGGGWAADGSTTSDSMGIGPGASTTFGAGSYGGRGGDTYDAVNAFRGGTPYGIYDQPTGPGSGGGSTDGRSGSEGGSGGGAVRLDVADRLLVNGTITANGEAGGGYSSAGSGGAVWLSCRTLAGTGGVVRANGLARIYPYASGGGGRIAVHYDPAAQSALPVPGIVFSALGGSSGSEAHNNRFGDVGSLYFTDVSLLAPVLAHSGRLYFGTNPPVLTFDSLTVSNGWIRLPHTGCSLVVSNTLTVTGSSGKLELGGYQYYIDTGFWRLQNTAPLDIDLTVQGDLILTNGGKLSIVAACTNGADLLTGADISIGGKLAIGSGSWLSLHSSPTNGGGARLTCANAYIQSGGGIDALGLGYTGGRGISGKGPGASSVGGSYGGRGGGASGSTYGSATNPLYSGSGGGGTDARPTFIGGSGGGVIRLEVDDVLSVNGTITANGQRSGVNYSGGGAGGSVNLTCRRFLGASTGLICADGGLTVTAVSSGGGGGRIRVKRIAPRSAFAGSFSVAGGSNTAAAVYGLPGTLVLEDAWIDRGTVIVVR